MSNTLGEHLFPGLHEGGSYFTISHSIDSYLIVDRRKNLVQALLFVLNPGLTDHDYDTTRYCKELSSEESPGINDLPEEIHREIENKLVEKGISLVTSKIIRNNSLYIHFGNSSHCSDPHHLILASEDEDFRWSLHILE